MYTERDPDAHAEMLTEMQTLAPITAALFDRPTRDDLRATVATEPVDLDSYSGCLLGFAYGVNGFTRNTISPVVDGSVDSDALDQWETDLSAHAMYLGGHRTDAHPTVALAALDAADRYERRQEYYAGQHIAPRTSAQRIAENLDLD